VVSVEAVLIPMSSVVAAFSAALLAGAVDPFLLALHISAIAIVSMLVAPENPIDDRLCPHRRCVPSDRDCRRRDQDSSHTGLL
jgi:hypothetical protein